MSEIQNKIEKLKTIQESMDVLTDSLVVNPVAKESTIITESQSIKSKIDNIKLPEIDTTELAKESTLNAVSSKLDNINMEVDLTQVAKQGSNLDATNTAIYALLSQFGESVLQEKVTVILNCQDNIAWQDYAVNVTFEDGRVQAVPLSENGTCTFSIKIGQNYSVQLPIIGAFIAPTLKTYTAISSDREIYWSYVTIGVFGMDELGRRYTIAQIEALEDKSIIKYGGYTDDYLENSARDDGGVGNGFMWDLKLTRTTSSWASALVEFDQSLLPFLTSDSMALPYCDGEAYTRYIISEGIRLGVTTPAATKCINTSIEIGNKESKGFLPAYGQLKRLINNETQYKNLYSVLGLTPLNLKSEEWHVSAQYSSDRSIRIYSNNFNTTNKTTSTVSVFIVYKLP